MRALFTFFTVTCGLLSVAFSNADMRGGTLFMVFFCALFASMREATI
ncbi:hypothetical protein GGD53_002977 [Rhizobium aethiopicum]|uniref:Uncharacterized protein n=1 Tax=Rhizobium aethiopicum TaxID=1138170 RepID=A0A7W6MHV3_9HYPH|nr:hypothetical protein [Rhizobium aethiopicum]